MLKQPNWLWKTWTKNHDRIISNISFSNKCVSVYPISDTFYRSTSEIELAQNQKCWSICLFFIGMTEMGNSVIHQTRFMYFGRTVYLKFLSWTIWESFHD